jgi:undecaprenyl diphosphate synthase
MAKSKMHGPEHIALIPDGNRRWARKKGLFPQVGHETGSRTLENILEKSLDLKIKYFTFWAASKDNLTKRSKREVDFLYKIFTAQFKRALKDERLIKNEVNVKVLGPWKKFVPSHTRKAIEAVVDKTKHYKKHFLTFLLAYNGTDEMIDCVQNILDSGIKHVTDQTIKNHLWTKNLPPVDLVIRTGCEGDPHMSAGFMMWDTAYSQLYFTKTLFPALTTREFEKAIDDFSNRDRRLGK